MRSAGSVMVIPKAPLCSVEQSGCQGDGGARPPKHARTDAASVSTGFRFARRVRCRKRFPAPALLPALTVARRLLLRRSKER
jgi:hypothetical protein